MKKRGRRGFDEQFRREAVRLAEAGDDAARGGRAPARGASRDAAQLAAPGARGGRCGGRDGAVARGGESPAAARERAPAGARDLKKRDGGFNR